MKSPRIRTKRSLVAAALAMTITAAGLATAAPASAQNVTPGQLAAAGWTCIHPVLGPPLTLCAPPGTGLPPLVGSPTFADRLPSYMLLAFDAATGELLGSQHLLRPDIYEQGTPPCPQRATGQFSYNPRNDMWVCNQFSL
jgi:hypothetical protein